MSSLMITLQMFGRAVRHAWLDPAFRFLALLAGLILGSGTLFYHWAEGWRWLDSLYFCVITLATVGYGDLTPKTDLGKIFTMFYVFMGIGLLVALFTRLSDSLMQAQREVMERHAKRLRRREPAD